MCARNLNLTIRTNGTCTTQQLSKRMTHSHFCGTLTYKRISCNNQPQNKKKEKRTCKIVDFASPADHGVKLKESEKKDKYLDLVRELKKLWIEKGANYIHCNWCSWYSHRRIIKRTGGLENKKTSGDHPNDYTIESRPEYWEESWWLEKTCSYSNFSERSSAYADVKNYQGVK